MTEYARDDRAREVDLRQRDGPAGGRSSDDGARARASLARYLIYTYPEYYHFFGEKEFKYRDKFVFHNRNPLIFAGSRRRRAEDRFIKEAGYGLVASAKRGDQRLILVVSGLDTATGARGEPRKLLDWGFKSFKPFRLFDQGQKVSDALVWGGTQHYVPLVGDGNINIILPTTATGKVSASIVYNGPIKAPIRKGDQRGGAARDLRPNSQATNEIPLYAGDDIDQSNFAMRGLDSLLVLAFGWLL